MPPTTSFDDYGKIIEYLTRDATISNGASLSAAIDLQGRHLIGIVMPADWTAANLTFQVAQTADGTFADVYDSAGNELVAVAAASRFICDIPELQGVRFLKIRSGTTGTPVNQGAARTLSLTIV